MNSILIDNISIGYKNKTVAESLSATVKGGELTCLIGRNGLGKSTLLHSIAGAQKALTGRILLNVDGKEYDVDRTPGSKLARLVAVVLTEKIDVANMTAEDIVGMGRMPYTGFFGRLSDDDHKIVDEAMAKTGTTVFAKRDITTLSDGERQKVMIARAIAQQTPFILLDEPTAFLDYPSKVETLRLLSSMAHDTGRAIIVSTHDLDIALRLADRLLTIDNGLKDVSKTELNDFKDSL